MFHRLRLLMLLCDSEDDARVVYEEHRRKRPQDAAFNMRSVVRRERSQRLDVLFFFLWLLDPVEG